MKVGLVGYQGCGKSALFQLLTGSKPDPAKVHSGQLGTAVVPDERFDRLMQMFKPKKVSPAKIELLDTPGLGRGNQADNAQRLSVMRDAQALVHVIGAFAGAEAVKEAAAFEDDCILADLQVVTNRISRLKQTIAKNRPDREESKAELALLEPLAATLEAGRSLQTEKFSDDQEKATRSFALLTRKRRLILLNTADSAVDQPVIDQLAAKGYRVVSGPVGLELEVEALDEADRAEFASAMGLTDSSRTSLLRAIFEVTDLITFYTTDEKEVRAWLIERGATALDAAGLIHTDLARGFIRAEIMAVADLLRLGSEREVKAANLHHVVGKDYVMKDGDEIVVRFSV